MSFDCKAVLPAHWADAEALFPEDHIIDWVLIQQTRICETQREWARRSFSCAGASIFRKSIERFVGWTPDTGHLY